VFEIGSTLREARRRQGLELAEIARETLIRERYLAALEEERLELMPARAYAKGFLRLYADFLGLDTQLFVDAFNSRFPETELPELAPPREMRNHTWGHRMPAALFVAFAVALLGLLAWRFGEAHRARPVSAPPQRAAHPSRAAATPLPRPPRAAVAQPGHLVLRARGRCWVLVRIGSESGPLLYEGTLVDGGTLRYTLAAGRPRFWLRVGAPWNLQVSLNGKPPIALPTEPVNLVVTRSRARRA
jgi:transcriptional regulator with XRE-family HTH domain